MKVAEKIRTTAIRKKSTLGRDQVPNDDQLLPTQECLEKALKDNEIDSVLSCKCHICQLPTRETNTTDIRVWFTEPRRKVWFASLVLSGCCFAASTVYNNRNRYPEFDDFVNAVSSSDDQELHTELFPSICPQEQRILRQHFCLALQSKMWIFRIPKLGVRSKLERYYYEHKQNFPFKNESLVMTNSRPGQEFIKCEVELSYCSEPEKLVCNVCLFVRQSRLS